MGSVYLAHDTSWTARCPQGAALQAEDGPEALARFYARRGAAAGLAHPSCAPFTTSPGQRIHYLTMPTRGQTLADLSRTTLPPAGRSSSRPGLRWLAEAHARGVIHRDLKPSNVMIDRVASRWSWTSAWPARGPGKLPLTRQALLGTPCTWRRSRSGDQKRWPAVRHLQPRRSAHECCRTAAVRGPVAVLAKVLTEEPLPPRAPAGARPPAGRHLPEALAKKAATATPP